MSIKPMFAQFLIVGIPPNGKPTDKPVPLVIYPPNQIESLPFAAIVDYSLPTGTKPQSEPILDEIITDMFMFRVHSATHDFISSCVLVTHKTGRLPFYASDATRNTQFAFVVTSRNGYFASHMKFCRFLANFASHRVLNPNILFAEPINVSQLIPQSIPAEYTQKLNILHHKSFPLPTSICDAVHKYFQFQHGDKKLRLSPYHYVGPTTLPARKYSEMFSFDTLFSTFPTRSILSLISCALCDNRIAFLGHSLQSVSMCVTALSHLLKPLKFSGAVVPILPAFTNYLTLLEAPTPYIIGVPKCDLLPDINLDEGVILADCDSGTVDFGECQQLQFPRMNDCTIQIDGIDDQNRESYFSFSSDFRKKKNPNCKVFSAGGVEAILGAVGKPLQKLQAEHIKKFFMKDLDAKDGVFFDKTSWVETVPKEDKEFAIAITESQAFTHFVDTVIKKHEDSEQTSSQF